MEDSLLEEVHRFYDSANGNGNGNHQDDQDEDKKDNMKNHALLFPAINSYLRFKVHQMVDQDQALKGELVTFSVGRDGNRRLVLTWKDKVKDGVIKEREEQPKDVTSKQVVEENPVKKEVTQGAESASGRKTRRPDRQVYVPRQKRKPDQPENIPDKESNEESRPTVIKTFQTLEEEIAASLIDGVQLVHSDLIVPTSCQDHSSSSSSHHFLTRWLKPEDADDDSSERIDPNLVLEVHDFDADLKTGDLARELSTYRGCFDLRWVDDTHALAVFKTAEMAARALQDKFIKIKLRRLEEGVEESKVRASKLAPPAAPVPRPQTSTLVARRMLGGALGVNLISDRREKMERDKLQKARSIKRRTSRDEDS